MSKNMFFGVNGVARKVKKIYFGVNAVARKVKKGYVGINGVARLFFASESTITLTGKATTVGNTGGTMYLAYIGYNGTSYQSGTRTFVAEDGDVIRCWARTRDSSKGKVFLNGSSVELNFLGYYFDGFMYYYDYVVTGGKVITINMSSNTSDSYYGGIITITET